MNTLKIFVFALIVGCALTACEDFFEETSQNQAYVSSVVDLDELLKGEAYINEEGFSQSMYYGGSTNRVMSQTSRYFPWIHVLDDDVTEFAEGYHGQKDSWIRANAASAYTWQPNPFVNKDAVEYAADDWNKAYKRIAVLNSIIYVSVRRTLLRKKSMRHATTSTAIFTLSSSHLKAKPPLQSHTWITATPSPVHS